MTTEIPVRADRSLKQAGAAANVRDEEEGAESLPPVEPAQDWWSPSSPLPPGLLGLLWAVLWVFTEFYLNHNNDHICYGSFLLWARYIKNISLYH